MMNGYDFAKSPSNYAAILAKSEQIEFAMPSDPRVGALLRTLVSAKPGGRFLEIGTGTGLSLSWLADGLSDGATLISIDNDPALCEIARSFFTSDTRVTIMEVDGGTWLETYSGPAFDLIFADAWPGKYSHLDESLALLRPGGFYVVDDMLEQPNWPEGHADKAAALLAALAAREDITWTALEWGTGVLVGVKA